MSVWTERKIAKTVFLVIASVLLFSAIIFSLYKFDLMKVIEFIPSIFHKDEAVPEDNNSDKIKQILELIGEDKKDYESISSDAHSVISMLSAAVTDDSYYHAYTVTYSYDKDIFVRDVRLYRQTSSCSVHILENGNVVKTINYEGDEYLVRDDSTGTSSVFSKDGGFSLDGQTYLPSISDVVSLLREYESAENGESDITDCKVELIRTQSANLVNVSFIYERTGQAENYTVHLDRGVILEASSKIDGQTYYKVETTVFDPNI